MIIAVGEAAYGVRNTHPVETVDLSAVAPSSIANRDVCGSVKTPGPTGVVPVTHAMVDKNKKVTVKVTSSLVVAILPSSGAMELTEPVPSPIVLTSPPTYVASVGIGTTSPNAPGAYVTGVNGATDPSSHNPLSGIEKLNRFTPTAAGSTTPVVHPTTPRPSTSKPNSKIFGCEEGIEEIA